MPKKKIVRTIDATPTWSGILPWLLSIYQDGNQKGKQVAIEQLKKMAEVADKYVEYINGTETEVVEAKPKKNASKNL